MNNITDYEAYFKSLAYNYIPINDFYHIDLTDFDSFVNDLRGNKYAVPLLILESYTGGTTAQHIDNIHNKFDGALVVLGQFNPRNVTKISKTTFLSEIEKHVLQLRAKMISDKKNPCSPMYGLLPETISWSKTETIAGTFQGYRMSFTILAQDTTTLTNWL